MHVTVHVAVQKPEEDLEDVNKLCHCYMPLVRGPDKGGFTVHHCCEVAIVMVQWVMIDDPRYFDHG